MERVRVHVRMRVHVRAVERAIVREVSRHMHAAQLILAGAGMRKAWHWLASY